MIFRLLLLEMKKTSIIYNDWIEYLPEMWVEEKAEFWETILKYQNWIEVNPQTWFKIIRKKIKTQIDLNNETYENKCKTNSENQKKRREKNKPKNTTVYDRIQSNTNENEPIQTNTDTDNDTKNDIKKIIKKDIKENNTEIVSNDTMPNGKIYIPKDISVKINNTISLIKEKCKLYSIVYDWKDERIFWNHINSKKFLGIANYYKFETWDDFAMFIIDCSMQEWNWRNFKCNWPKVIYQKYPAIIWEFQKLGKWQENKPKQF